jgi:ubiquinone/menaquinone biosynthesis C-methylase UbiE
MNLTSSSIGGSYSFGSFRDNDQELARLKQQAQIALALEKAMWKQIGVRPGMQVLDLASGPGVISCELAKAVEPGTVTGLDVNPKMIEVAEEHRASTGVTNASFQQGDAYALPFEEGSFDLVYARFLLQHLNDPVRVFREALRVLKPGGILFAADVDDASILIHPEPPGFPSFLERAQRAQREKGGNRLVGRLLYSLCLEAGFDDTYVGVLPVTTQDIGVPNFLGIVTGYKREIIEEEDTEAVERELQAILALGERKDAWGVVGVFFTVARKQSDDRDRGSVRGFTPPWFRREE